VHVLRVRDDGANVKVEKIDQIFSGLKQHFFFKLVIHLFILYEYAMHVTQNIAITTYINTHTTRVTEVGRMSAPRIDRKGIITTKIMGNRNANAPETPTIDVRNPK